MRKEIKNAFGRTFYTIEYNSDSNIVDAMWYGYVSKQDFKAALETGLELMEQVRCPYRLNNNLELTGPWSELVDWIAESWLPRAMKAGVKYLAHVSSANSFGEMAGEAMRVSKIGQELIYRTFSSREAALDWLAECQQKDLAAAIR